MTSPAPLTGDALLGAVTDAMIALHQRYHHRSPVTAKTLMLGDDLMACVMGGVYTDVEKTMIEVQRGTTVQETRSAFQNAMQHRFIEAVERLSGRGVLAFISNQHIGPDIETASRSSACRRRARWPAAHRRSGAASRASERITAGARLTRLGRTRRRRRAA